MLCPASRNEPGLSGTCTPSPPHMHPPLIRITHTLRATHEVTFYRARLEIGASRISLACFQFQFQGTNERRDNRRRKRRECVTTCIVPIGALSYMYSTIPASNRKEGSSADELRSRVRKARRGVISMDLDLECGAHTHLDTHTHAPPPPLREHNSPPNPLSTLHQPLLASRYQT